MRVRGLAFLFVGALVPCFPAVAQTEPRITLEATSAGIVAHVEPAPEHGSVLLSSAGRIIGYRPLKQGEAQWTTADLPLGTWRVQAAFQGVRSAPISFSAAASPVSRFAETEAAASKLPAAKALTPVGADLVVLSRRALYGLHRDGSGRIGALGGTAGALGDSVAVADFNGDGLPDLASSAKGHVEVVFGQANGQPGAPIEIQKDGDPVQLVSGDFNGDGIADLAILTTTTGEIRVFYGTADGRFQGPAQARPASGGPAWLAAADLNGDGRASLVVADTVTGTITVLNANQNEFAPAASYSAEGIPAAITTGDFSGAGKPDIVWLNTDGFIHIAGRFGPAGQVEPGTSLMAAADLNHDGRLDLVFGGRSGLQVSWGLDRSGVQPLSIVAHTSPSFIVTSAADDGGGGTLRSMVQQAAQSVPATVTFDSRLLGATITLKPCTGFVSLNFYVYPCAISVPAGVSIDGQSLGIHIDGGGQSRVLEIYGNSRIANLTLQNGVAQGGRGANGYVAGGGAAGMGGAVFVQGAGNQFQNVLFQSNQAIGGNGGDALNGYPLAGGGGGGLGGDGGQASHGTDYVFAIYSDSGGDGGPGGVLGGSGGSGGTELDIDLKAILDTILELAITVVEPEIEADSIPEILATAATDTARDHFLVELIDNAVGGFSGGKPPDLVFSNKPTDGGPGAGGGGGAQAYPFGLSGGFGGGGGGSADPVNGIGGRSIFGGGSGGGGDTKGPGRGGSAYGGAVFIYPGASADFDGCTFTSNQAVGGRDGLLLGYALLGQAPSVGGGLFVADGGQATINTAHVMKIDYTNRAGTAPFFFGRLVVPLSLSISNTTGGMNSSAAAYSFTVTLPNNVFSPAVVILTGTVDFYDGETYLGSGAVSNNQASYQGARLPAGLRHVRAVYTGNNGAQGFSASVTNSLRVYPIPSSLPTSSSSAGGIFNPLYPALNLITTDLNGDGIPDLAMATGLTDSTGRFAGIYAALGKGDGTFGGFGFAFPNSLILGGMAASDFGGRGAVSIATEGPNGIQIQRVDGLGDFPTPSSSPAASGGQWMVAADFNRDGFPDVASASCFYYQCSPLVYNPIQINLSSAAGILSPAAAPPVPAGLQPSAFAVADLNGDGIPDLITGSATTSQIWVNLGHGDGSFQNPVLYNVAGTVRAIAVGDFDGNGKPDLVVADAAGITVLMGNGDGTFQSFVSSPVTRNIYLVAAADFNGDGFDDVVAADVVGNRLYICLSPGSPSVLNCSANVPAGGTFVNFAVGDFNRDGTPDIAVLLNTGLVKIFQGRPLYSLSVSRSTPSFYQSQSAQYNVTVGDAQSFSGALGITLSFPVPYQAGGNGWTCWTVLNYCQITGTFAAGKIPVLPVAFTVPTQGGPYTLTATLGTPANLSASDTFTPLAPNISLTVTPPQQYLFWDSPSTQFTITVQNHTPVPYAGLEMVVTLPHYLNPGTLAGAGWQCNGTTCTRTDALPPNGSLPVLTLPATYSQQDQTLLTANFSLQIKPAVGSPYELTSQTATIQTGQRPNLKMSVAPVSPTLIAGQQNAPFLITLTNSAGGTVGPTTVTTTPGAGLTAASMSGLGWTCGASSCTTNHTLLAGVVYSLQANVNVSGNPPASVTESASLTTPGATASGNGSANVNQTNLVMRVSHAGTIARGSLATWSITVSNTSSVPSLAAISVTDFLPLYTTATAITGLGWNCDLPSLTCSRGDTLKPGFSYPPINVTANVQLAYGISVVTNTAYLTGAGNPFSASDSVPLGFLTSITLLPPSNSSATFLQPVTLNASISAPTSTPGGSVIFLDNGNFAGAALVTSSAASFTTRSLAPGKHVFRAVYSGDINNGSSASNLQTVAVKVAPYRSDLVHTASVPSGGRESPGPLVFDFNGDGIPDLAVPSNNDYTVTFYTGNGDGTFTKSQTVQLYAGLSQAVAGDFNGDGLPDVAVSGQGGIFILLNSQTNAGNRFVFPAGTAYGNFVPSCLVNAMATGDFNLDGRVDIAAVNTCGGIDILFGNGDGTIGADRVYPTNAGGQPSAVIGDFNGDGIPDIAVGDDYGGAIHVLLGQPGGSFAAPIDSPTPVPSVAKFSTADFNQDGIADLAVPLYGQSPFDPTGGVVCLFFGKGDGTFTQIGACRPAPGASATVTGDFNADGIPDVAYSFQGGLGVLYGTTTPNDAALPFGLVPSGIQSADSDGIGLIAADFNGDGFVDLAVNTGQASTLDIYLNSAPRWTIQLTHVGTPTMGANGVQYQIQAVNVGTVSTSTFATTGDYTHGPYTVTEMPGPGISITGMSGNGWTCDTVALTCTRSEVRNASPLPVITVTANVTAASIVNTVKISGGGASNSPTAQDTAVTTTNTVKLTLQGNPTGAVQVTVGNSTYTLPAVVPVPTGVPTNISVALYSNLPAAGTRYRFTGWSDGGTATHPVTLTADTILTASFVTQYQVTTSVYPAGGGTVTAGGWFDGNTSVTLNASPASGYAFTQWAGINGGASLSTTFTLAGPTSATANFAVSVPSLTWSIASKTDGSASPARVWTISVANTKGIGTAQGVQITSAVVTLQSGAGPVSVVSSLPVSVGDIPAGQSASVPLTLSFPATTPATFISLKLTFSAGNGAYSVSQTQSFQAR